MDSVEGLSKSRGGRAHPDVVAKKPPRSHSKLFFSEDHSKLKTDVRADGAGKLAAIKTLVQDRAP